MMTGQQPEALRLADELERDPSVNLPLVVAELRSLYAGNAALRSGYEAARHEIEAQRNRVQELGQMARDCNSRRVIELQAKVRELEDMLAAVGAGGVEPLRKSPVAVTGAQLSQFLADVMTAAGLVEHGKQCKALAARLAEMAMRLRVNPPPKADHFRDATEMVSTQAAPESLAEPVWGGEWVTAPAKATLAMCEASGFDVSESRTAYARMIAAAPEPPTDHLRDATEMIGANEAPARKPLTDRQIQEIWCSARSEGNQTGPFWFAHAIERAHGIT